MTVSHNNPLIDSRVHLVKSIDKMNDALEQIKGLYCENENTMLKVARAITEGVAKTATSTSETILALNFLRSISPNNLHNKIISEIEHHKVNVEGHNMAELNEGITNCLLKTSELKKELNNIQQKIETLREKLYPRCIVRWAKDVSKVTKNDTFIALASKSFLSGLFSSRISHARKLENQKKRLVSKVVKILQIDDGAHFNSSPQDIIEQNNSYFSELTYLAEQQKALTWELSMAEESELNMLHKLADVANSKRYLNTYDHDLGIKQRLLELVFEHELSNDEIVSYCKIHGSWNLAEEHKTYEAKKMFLSIKLTDLQLHLDYMKRCLVILNELISGKFELSTWLKFRSERILKVITTYTTIFTEYTLSLLKACVDAYAFKQESGVKLIDSYSLYLSLNQRFKHKKIPTGNLPSALFKSLLNQTNSPLCADDLNHLLETNYEPAYTS